MPPPELLRDLLLEPILYKLQECIRKNSYTIYDTKKNKKTMAYFGWSINDQENVLLSLECSDCHKVDNNRNKQGSNEPVYIFHKGYEGHQLYIKIAFEIIEEPDTHNDFAKIMSLHITDNEKY